MRRDDASGSRKVAFAAFDAAQNERAEEDWARARGFEAAVRVSDAQAEDALETALQLEPADARVRALLADLLSARLDDAEREGRRAEGEALLRRLARFDDDGSRRARHTERAEMSVTTTPPGARARLSRYGQTPEGRRPLSEPEDLGPTPVRARALAPGSYRLELEAPGRARVRLPFVIARGERLPLAVDLPLARSVPAGFVHVPAGRFLLGLRGDDDLRRGFFYATPLHEVHTGAYLVARTETTYAEWIAFLESLPPAERRTRSPGGTHFNGATVRLVEEPSGWRLELRPKNRRYIARLGEPLVYERRARRDHVDWRRLPVTGISSGDAEAFVSWLADTGRVPGARLCTELEWERAARGADDRDYPHGDRLDPDDADFDLTYGRVPEAFGPDEVGSHPASESAFGLLDASGNVFEWTRALGARGFALKGGSYDQDRSTLLLPNREPTEPALRTPMIGLRVCADIH